MRYLLVCVDNILVLSCMSSAGGSQGIRKTDNLETADVGGLLDSAELTVWR